MARATPLQRPSTAPHANAPRPLVFSVLPRSLTALSAPLSLARSVNKASFDSLLVAHTESILPFIYTPTVGEACQHYDELKVPTYGLYIRHTDRGHIKDILSKYADKDIRCARERELRGGSRRRA